VADSFAKMATVTASTKRVPAIGVDGTRGAAATNVASLTCTPLDPVDPELKETLRLETAHTVLETYVDGSIDIVIGDILVVGSTEYLIRAAEDWTYRSSKYLHLILEALKR